MSIFDWHQKSLPRAELSSRGRLFAYRDPEGFQRLMDLLVEVSIEYLSGQVRAGADALQIFDTWAGSLPDDQFERWFVLCARCTRRSEG